MKGRLKQNAFGYWMIVHPQDDSLAWSGSRWVPIDPTGFPAGGVQVSSLPTEDEALEYAWACGFTTVTVAM